ncbi:MAG: thioredoxin-disulfide reductase [Oscillospiraceae bacterium]|nr:thioredoxin-disulfide reductase [Oscillospiraceae bacterium]
MNHVYDLIVIGGGPGGYTAALYAARAGLSVVVLEKLSAGGQMALTHQIDNYPGFPEGIDGFELGEKMQAQAEQFGAKTEYAQVEAVELNADPKAIHTDSGVFYGKTVVIATGADPKKLGLPNEDALIGKGVAYCAACDGQFYRGKTVAVIGGGNSAAADALLLSRVAKKVYLVHRRDSLRADKSSSDPLFKAENVEFIWNSQVVELLQEEKLTGIRLQDGRVLSCDGVFISIGRDPATKLVKGQLELDDRGYILADETTKTSLPGVFAVGDVRKKPLHQIVTAVADGAVAAHMAQISMDFFKNT